jgi:hypothetical protein
VAAWPDLARDGMPAQTVAKFLARGEIEPGSVVLLDEGGQVSTKQMREIMRLTERAGGRLIISGDTRQHGAVETSDALVALERFAGLKAAEIRTVRRQNPKLAKNEEERARSTAYRTAVEAASDGKTGVSFATLERIGAITDVSADALVERTAERFLATRDEGLEVLAVSQTRAATAQVNADNRFHGFAYHHFRDLALDPNGTELVVTLWSHKLTIRGAKLRALARAMSRGKDVSLRVFAAQYERTAGANGLVTSVTIEETKEGEPAAAAEGANGFAAGDGPAELP